MFAGSLRVRGNIDVDSVVRVGQRIHSGGSIFEGEAEMALVIGKRANGEDYSRTETVAFTKEIKPKLVGLTVSGDSISATDW